MKTTWTIIILLAATAGFTHVTPAPRALVVQETSSDNGHFGREAKRALLAVLSKDVLADKVSAFSEVLDDEGPGRSRMRTCVEFKSVAMYEEAITHYEKALAPWSYLNNSGPIEILSASTCR